MSPRFQGEAFYDNLKIVDELDRLAKEKNLETLRTFLCLGLSLGTISSRVCSEDRTDG
jgi:pyridoxine 4-dehydrogenase